MQLSLIPPRWPISIRDLAGPGAQAGRDTSLLVTGVQDPSGT